MKLNRSILILIFVVFLVACSTQKYGKNDLIAILKGEEIKGKDILVLYPLEEKYIEFYLKQEIIIHEAKKMGIIVSEKEIEDLKQTIYQSYESYKFNDFYKKQAKTLKIPAEEYFETWSTTYLEKNEYFQKYLRTMFILDSISSDEDIEEFDNVIEEHINELFTTYINNKDLIIY